MLTVSCSVLKSDFSQPCPWYMHLNIVHVVTHKEGAWYIVFCFRNCWFIPLTQNKTSLNLMCVYSLRCRALVWVWWNIDGIFDHLLKPVLSTIEETINNKYLSDVSAGLWWSAIPVLLITSLAVLWLSPIGIGSGPDPFFPVSIARGLSLSPINLAFLRFIVRNISISTE